MITYCLFAPAQAMAGGDQKARAAAMAGSMLALSVLVVVAIISAVSSPSPSVLLGGVPLPPPRFSRSAAQSAGLRVPPAHPSMKQLEAEHTQLQRQLQILRAFGQQQQHGMMLSATQPIVDDGNPLDRVTVHDAMMDPDYRPALRSPGPHFGNLNKQNTGDYASVNTYRNLVDNKNNLDWCTEQFDTLGNRVRCIRKMIPAGPLLA